MHYNHNLPFLWSEVAQWGLTLHWLVQSRDPRGANNGSLGPVQQRDNRRTQGRCTPGNEYQTCFHQTAVLLMEWRRKFLQLVA